MSVTSDHTKLECVVKTLDERTVENEVFKNAYENHSILFCVHTVPKRHGIDKFMTFEEVMAETQKNPQPLETLLKTYIPMGVIELSPTHDTTATVLFKGTTKLCDYWNNKINISGDLLRIYIDKSTPDRCFFTSKKPAGDSVSCTVGIVVHNQRPENYSIEHFQNGKRRKFVHPLSVFLCFKSFRQD